MLVHLRPAIVMLVLFTIVTGLVYPLVITAAATAIAPATARGSLVVRDNAVVGSALIGQPFTSDRYFHGRPSATSAPDPKNDAKTIDAPYNAAGSGGSNLGPLSKKLLDRVETDVAALRKEGTAVIPADAVTTSASGLDPHISPAFARFQVGRVAAARAVAPDKVEAILSQHVTQPWLGVFGTPRVNVLALNLALDAAFGRVAG